MAKYVTKFLHENVVFKTRRCPIIYWKRSTKNINLKQYSDKYFFFLLPKIQWKPITYIWATPCKNVPSSICREQRHRSAYASMQSDQALYCPLIESLPSKHTTLKQRWFNVLRWINVKIEVVSTFCDCWVGTVELHSKAKLLIKLHSSNSRSGLLLFAFIPKTPFSCRGSFSLQNSEMFRYIFSTITLLRNPT